ncbi:MAG TPA: ABC transporter permease [Candidatus Nanopelagicaceae bacterium]|nr:ABC transporter permease [Candidatus Nanopelagicaceae bacterium]
MSEQTTIGTGQEGSLRDQVEQSLMRLKGGEMGSLPAVLGFVILAILFSSLSPVFLTAINFANFFTQAATLITLSMGLVFVLLLGEIDLSAGVTSGVTGAVLAVLMATHGVVWWLALLTGIGVGIIIGLAIGLLVAKVGIPSFVVTLAAFLAFQGLQLVIIGEGGLYRVASPYILNIENGNLSRSAGWGLVVIVILGTLLSGLGARRQRTNSGQVNRPITILYARTIAIGLLCAGTVYALNLERSFNPEHPLFGVPMVIPMVAVLLLLGTFLLDRTAFGRHLYAVGGNAEAARRAGINVSRVKIIAFTLCSTIAALSGVISASRTGSVDASAGRTIVLNGVAAAVVGGVSLFGGKGRLSQAAIGGFVIAMIDNGLGLLGLNAGVNLAVTGGVLLLASTADALSRKRGSAVVR